MKTKFEAWSEKERKLYSSGSDPVIINLDGKCINTITGEELRLFIVQDDGRSKVTKLLYHE